MRSTATFVRIYRLLSWIIFLSITWLVTSASASGIRNASATNDNIISISKQSTLQNGTESLQKLGKIASLRESTAAGQSNKSSDDAIVNYATGVDRSEMKSLNSKRNKTEDKVEAKDGVVSEQDLKENPAFDVNKLFKTKPPSSKVKDNTLLEKEEVKVIKEEHYDEQIEKTNKNNETKSDENNKENEVKHDLKDKEDFKKTEPVTVEFDLADETQSSKSDDGEDTKRSS